MVIGGKRLQRLLIRLSGKGGRNWEHAIDFTKKLLPLKGGGIRLRGTARFPLRSYKITSKDDRVHQPWGIWAFSFSFIPGLCFHFLERGLLLDFPDNSFTAFYYDLPIGVSLKILLISRVKLEEDFQ